MPGCPGGCQYEEAGCSVVCVVCGHVPAGGDLVLDDGRDGVHLVTVCLCVQYAVRGTDIAFGDIRITAGITFMTR